MKKLLLCLGLCLSVTTFAQKKEWLDPELNAINRAPARADYFAYPSREMAEQGVREESSNFLSLNGMWKFNWVKDQTETFIGWISRINIGWTSRCPESGK